MSQNLDATAINQIHALISAQGVNEIISKIGADAVALPENFRIHDLEKFNLNRFRFRGALSTASIDDFTRYSKDLADEGTRCFIDADNMRAVSVLNLGTIDEACIAALQSPLHTVQVSAGDGITEERKCHSSAEVKYGTPVSHCRTVKDLNSLLEQRTKGRRQNSMTS